MKKFYKTALTVYKLLFSYSIKVIFGSDCRFQPTCSEYTAQALSRYGILKGSLLSIKRLARCNPWGGFGLDPLKDKSFSEKI